MLRYLGIQYILFLLSTSGNHVTNTAALHRRNIFTLSLSRMYFIEYTDHYNSSVKATCKNITHQVCSVTLEGLTIVSAASTKQPKDMHGNHTSGTSTSDKTSMNC